MNLELGKTYKRSDLHDSYGGQRQGGISTPAERPYVLLFTGPQGEEFGYKDGWSGDHRVYLYTGQGQVGDMEFRRGNLAIRDHALNGKDLLLFSQVSPGYVRFEGRMRYAAHEFREGKDGVSEKRKMIVFRLVPRS